MAGLPPLSSLNVEQMLNADGQLDAEKLIYGFNQFAGGTSNALSRQLTFVENFQATIKEARLVIPGPVWIAPTYLNSWANYGGTLRTGGYRIRPDGVVDVRFTVATGTTGHIFTLPTGYVPSLDETRAGWSAGIACAITVNGQTNANPGRVVATAYNNTDVHGHFSFEASSTGPCAAPAAFTGVGWPVQLRHDLPKCSSVLPLRCNLKDGKRVQAVPCPPLDWYDVGDGSIRINSAYGLQPGQTYFLRLLMLAE